MKDAGGMDRSIRIAGLLLILSGWKSTQVAELFGLTTFGAVGNSGSGSELLTVAETVTDRARSVRPPRPG